MNTSYEKVFYNSVMLICALMTVVNLSRFKSRGYSAIFLGAAFLVLGITSHFIAEDAKPFIWAGGIIVFLLLAADMVYRIARQSQPTKRGSRPGGRKS